MPVPVKDGDAMGVCIAVCVCTAEIVTLSVLTLDTVVVDVSLGFVVVDVADKVAVGDERDDSVGDNENDDVGGGDGVGGEQTILRIAWL